MKMTKMVCTIGPKSEPREVMEKLIDNGMNVMRLNFSHGDYEEHGARIKTARAIAAETGKLIAGTYDAVHTLNNDLFNDLTFTPATI